MLTISSVGYRHSGTYTCTAKNKAGVTSQTATLKVNGNFMEKAVERIGCRLGLDIYGFSLYTIEVSVNKSGRFHPK